MTCNCQKEQHAVYAKSDEYADTVHCDECKFNDGVYNCTRFTSSITGGPVLIKCIEARTDESLCGVLGRYWVKKGE